MVSLAQLVHVAGRRWTVEESFQSSKGLAGLDQHQVRTWTSWHRWTILVLLAHAFLTVTTVAHRARETPDPTLIRLSVNEFRRLFIALILAPLHTHTLTSPWDGSLTSCSTSFVVRPVSCFTSWDVQEVKFHTW